MPNTLDAQEVRMGDDAEFQMEFEARGPWWEDLGAVDETCVDEDCTDSGYPEAPSYYGGTPLLVLDGGTREAIWGWNESIPIPYTLTDLHSRWGIGSQVFTCSELPTDADSDLQLRAIESADARAFEVVIVTHDDEILLQTAASELMSADGPLRERMIGEMLELVLETVQASPSRTRFVFALAQR